MHFWKKNYLQVLWIQNSGGWPATLDNQEDFQVINSMESLGS